ncbi:hypothetical protein TKK_0018341 [Trichogramma kaykai]
MIYKTFDKFELFLKSHNSSLDGLKVYESEDFLDLDDSRSLYEDLEKLKELNKLEDQVEKDDIDSHIFENDLIKSEEGTEESDVCSVKTKNLLIRRSKSFTYPIKKSTKKSKTKRKRQRLRKVQRKSVNIKRVVPRRVIDCKPKSVGEGHLYILVKLP